MGIGVAIGVGEGVLTGGRVGSGVNVGKGDGEGRGVVLAAPEGTRSPPAPLCPVSAELPWVRKLELTGWVNDEKLLHPDSRISIPLMAVRWNRRYFREPQPMYALPRL